jgi:hypothetical protein
MNEDLRSRLYTEVEVKGFNSFQRKQHRKTLVRIRASLQLAVYMVAGVATPASVDKANTLHEAARERARGADTAHLARRDAIVPVSTPQEGVAFAHRQLSQPLVQDGSHRRAAEPLLRHRRLASLFWAEQASTPDVQQSKLVGCHYEAAFYHWI